MLGSVTNFCPLCFDVMLDLSRHHTQPQCMLQLKDAPGFATDDVVMTHAQHQQGDQHRHLSGFLAAILVPTDLMRAQAQSRLAFPMHHLHGPALLVDTHDWARRQRGQIGHQDFRLFGAQVSPSFTPYHSDITHMTQTQPSVRRPKGPAASASGLSGNPGALVILMRHMGHEVFERVLVHGFPGVSDGKDKAPPACRIGLVPVLDHLHVRLGAIGRIPADNPREGGEGHHHGQRSLQREDRVPESPRDIVDARRLLLVLREGPDTGQFAGTCLMLKLNRAD